MKIAFASHHLPHPHGSASGRQLWAIVEAMRTAGHDATVWCWGGLPSGMRSNDIPAWCDHQPLPAPPRSLRGLRQTIVAPRAHLAGAWRPPAGASIIADGRDSWPAVPVGVEADVVIHHSVALDARATAMLRVGTASAVQERRLERRAVASARTAAALSARVKAAVGASREVVATVPMPAGTLKPVDRPVALMLADWQWAPNRLALRRALEFWPRVQSSITGAELIIAGRNTPEIFGRPGVRCIGEVSETGEALAMAALLLFPCPPSSGPKLKVLDAVLHGVPVVTTSAGVEGLRCDGVVVADDRALAATTAELLADPARRHESAYRALNAAKLRHDPAVAASSWLSLVDDRRRT